MKPAKWISPLAVVHRQRLRFHVGTWDEAKATLAVTLCGLKLGEGYTPAAMVEPVTCGTCKRAESTRAHLK